MEVWVVWCVTELSIERWRWRMSSKYGTRNLTIPMMRDKTLVGKQLNTLLIARTELEGRHLEGTIWCTWIMLKRWQDWGEYEMRPFFYVTFCFYETVLNAANYGTNTIVKRNKWMWLSSLDFGRMKSLEWNLEESTKLFTTCSTMKCNFDIRYNLFANTALSISFTTCYGTGWLNRNCY